MNWTDRERVEKVWDEPPTELLNWFLRGNYTDIDFWRRISKVQYLLPQKYYKASVIHGLKPSRARVSWPKKKVKVNLTNLTSLEIVICIQTFL